MNILSIVLLVVGFVLLIKGADFFVEGSSDLANKLKVPSMIIGLTIVAFGTSLPELATTVVAAIRKQNGVALGNIVGSNIWNIVFIMGLTSSIIDVDVPRQFMLYDIWVMVAATFILLQMMISQSKLSRGEGAFFLLLYTGYIISQILLAQGIWVL